MGNVDLGIVCTGKGAVVAQGVDQRDEVDGFALGVKRAHRLVDGAVLIRIEHFRFHIGDEAVQHRFIHQGGAQHALLSLHVVGHLDAQTGQAQFFISRHGRLPSFCL